MIYLRASNEEEFNAALVEAGWLVLSDDPDIPEEKIFFTSGHSLDVIGVYQRQVGETVIDSDGAPQATFEDVEGYHANLLLHGDQMPESLEALTMDGKDGRPNPPASAIRSFA